MFLCSVDGLLAGDAGGFILFHFYELVVREDAMFMGLGVPAVLGLASGVRHISNQLYFNYQIYTREVS